jgi:hypothetical protein
MSVIVAVKFNFEAVNLDAMVAFRRVLLGLEDSAHR